MMRRIEPRNRGQDLVEAALVLPLLMLLILGIVEFGMAVFAYNTVANAAREGARVGILLAPGDEAMIKDAVIQRTGGLNLGSDDITVDWPDSQSGDPMVEVAVTYDHGWISGPIISAVGGGGEVELRSVATMRRERRD